MTARMPVALAGALLRDPRLLVVDEPTTGLDPGGIADLHDLVRDLAAGGRTVVLSSHDMAEVDRLCDAVTVLARGRVVHAGSLPELRARAVVTTLAWVASLTAALLGGAVGVAWAGAIVNPVQAGVWWWQFRRALRDDAPAPGSEPAVPGALRK